MATAVSIPPIRLWRARRRHAHIDAVLARHSRRWILTFLKNDRALVSFEFGTAREARTRARARLTELQLAGWTEHW
jgi:hypothetical protein